MSNALKHCCLADSIGSAYEVETFIEVDNQVVNPPDCVNGELFDFHEVELVGSVGRETEVWGLTFEFTRPAGAGGVSPVCDDATAGTDRAYAACRSGSGVQRGVRHQRDLARCAWTSNRTALGRFRRSRFSQPPTVQGGADKDSGGGPLV